MKGWPVVWLGVGLMILAYWLIGPLWDLRMIPPNPALPGHGPADWDQAVSPGVLAKATHALLLLPLAGLIMVLGWRGLKANQPGPWSQTRRGLRRFFGYMLCFFTFIPAVLALEIVGHDLHWTHDQSDRAAREGFAVIAAVGAACTVGYGLWLVAKATRGVRSGRGCAVEVFSVAQLTLPIGFMAAIMTLLALYLAAPYLPISPAARYRIEGLMTGLEHWRLAWFIGISAVFGLLMFFQRKAVRGGGSQRPDSAE